MMNEIVRAIKEKGFEAEVREVVKNGQVSIGITYGKADDNVRPTIYPQNMIDDDKSIDSIIDYMLDVYNNKGNHMGDFDINKISDPEFIREHAILCVQKCSDEPIIKEKLFDLELYVRVYISDEASFKLPETLLNKVPDIIQVAYQNTKPTFKVNGMLDILQEMMQMTKEEIKEMVGDDTSEEHMYTITNKIGLHGASALAFDYLFKEFCSDHECKGCYIIPSSIHELILIPDDQNDIKEYVDNMVYSTNQECLEECERLSDHSYYYNATINKITY